MLHRCMNHLVVTASVFAIVSVLCVTSGCTFVLPESQNLPSNTTQRSTSTANLTVSVQPLGERQRYSLSPVISHTAKDGYTLALYEVNITNLDRAVKAGDTAFFTLIDTNGTTYNAVLVSFSPDVIQRGESVSGTVVFEVPLSAVPRELRYDDGTNQMTVRV